MDPLNNASNAVVFGHLGQYYVGQYYVGLGSGLVAQFYVDRPAFRAVVLHEFAHLYNADINKSYFTVALWQAFLVLVTPLVPAGASLLWYRPDWDSVYSIIWNSIVAINYETGFSTSRGVTFLPLKSASGCGGASP